MLIRQVTMEDLEDIIRIEMIIFQLKKQQHLKL